MNTRFFYASFGEQAFRLLSFVMRGYIPRPRTRRMKYTLHLLNAMKALYSTEILCTQDGEYPVL